MKVSASHRSCEAKLCESNGGNARPCSPAGICSCELMVCAAALAIVELEREEQQQRDQEGEDPECLGHGKAEDEIGELPLRSRGIADRGGKIVAEDGADADACASHPHTGDAGTDHLCSLGIHDRAPSLV